jgi:hypothetical protein
LDLTFIIKDADGSTAMFEYDQLPEAAGFADIDGESDGLFSDEDLEIAQQDWNPTPRLCSSCGGCVGNRFGQRHRRRRRPDRGR